MRRCLAALLSPLLLVGCHRPADNFAKLDVADPNLAGRWVQFRHEPGGYAFQAPQSWVVDPQQDAQRLLARSGTDTDLFLRILDFEAAKKNDLVSFGVTRLAFGDERELKVTNLDDLGAKALKAMEKNGPGAKHERLTLPIGQAEHVWTIIEKPFADGSRTKITSHMVIFATALRPFVLMYGYPTDKEAEYRPTLDTMVRSVRLFLPKKDGRVVVPASAHAPASAEPVFAAGHPDMSNPRVSLRQDSNAGSPGPANVQVDQMAPPNEPTANDPAPMPQDQNAGANEPPTSPDSAPNEVPSNGGGGATDPAVAPPSDPNQP